MTRYLILFSALCSGYFAHAQNVGIGTSTPAAKLDVIGNIKITDGTQGANKVLTSGADGMATWAPPPLPACFFFASDASMANADYIGLGTASSSFTRNTLVVPFNCELSSIVFSVRAFIAGTNLSASVWVQRPGSPPILSFLSATIPNGSISYTAIGIGSVLLFAGDLISIRYTGTTLVNGAAVTLTYK